MVDSIDFAAQRKREHPDWSYGDSADAYEVPNSTLYGHYTSQPAGHAATTPHRLCIEQEEQLILKINACASRGAIILKSLQKPPVSNLRCQLGISLCSVAQGPSACQVLRF